MDALADGGLEPMGLTAAVDDAAIIQTYGEQPFSWSHSDGRACSYSSLRRSISGSFMGSDLDRWQVSLQWGTRSWSGDYGWSWSNDSDCWGSRSGGLEGWTEA